MLHRLLFLSPTASHLEARLAGTLPVWAPQGPPAPTPKLLGLDLGAGAQPPLLLQPPVPPVAECIMSRTVLCSVQQQ
jgi:hypothetical protein